MSAMNHDITEYSSRIHIRSKYLQDDHLNFQSSLDISTQLLSE